MILFKGKISLLQLLQKVHHVSPHVQDIDWFSSWWLWSSHLIFKFQIPLLISIEYGKAKVVVLKGSPCSSLLLFSGNVMSDFLWPHGLQHTTFPCPSLFPGVCSNTCPLSWWCYPTITSFVTPFSSQLQSFPASRSFPKNQLFPLGGQSIGVSPSAPFLPMNIQGWFPLGFSGLIFLLSKGLSRVFCNTTILWQSAFFMVQLSHPYMTTGKTIALAIQTCVGKGISLLFNMLSRFVIAFPTRSKCLLISQIIPLTWSMEKVSSTKPVPGAKKFGDHCSKKRKNHQQYTCTKGCLYGKINCKTVASCMPKERTLEEPSCWHLNLEPSASRIEKEYIPVV